MRKSEDVLASLELLYDVLTSQLKEIDRQMYEVGQEKSRLLSMHEDKSGVGRDIQCGIRAMKKLIEQSGAMNEQDADE